jgi:hypothetical protein
MMARASKKYTFTEEVWIYPSETASWYFVTLPDAVSIGVRNEVLGRPRAGFGSIRVRVTMGKSTWETSIFPDARSKSYLLPIKASIRRCEQVYVKDHVTISLSIVTSEH